MNIIKNYNNPQSINSYLKLLNTIKSLEKLNQLKEIVYNLYMLSQNNNGTSINYTSFNKASKIVSPKDTISFYYNTNKNRYDTSNMLIPSTKYLHYVRIVIKVNSFTFIDSEPEVMCYKSTTNGNSVDTITNNLGVVESRMAYKPFGQRLSLDKNGYPSSKTPTTNRGFTGHEHVEETNIINMNARLYDPTIGRFLSADTMIPYMYDTQSFNRYSYVRNNPLKYIDPSGHWGFSSITKAFKKVINEVHRTVKRDDIGTRLMYTSPVKNFFRKYQWARTVGMVAASWFGGPYGAAGFSAYLTDIQGGSGYNIAKSASIAFASAMVAQKIGDAYGHDSSYLAKNGGGTGYASVTTGYANATMKAAAHGVSRAAFAIAQGQKTSSAFWSGFVSSGFASTSKNGAVGTAITATVSGTVSHITGGKFANGAVTGAFIHLFNAWGRDRDDYAMKKALGERTGPKTTFGKAIANTIDKGIKGFVTGVIGTKNFFGGLSIGITSAAGGYLQSYANESGLNIDSINKMGATKVIIRENKHLFQNEKD